MERIIDLSLRHKDRLMAGQPWLMKIIILLKLKFFSLFSRNLSTLPPARPTWPPVSNAKCDLLLLCFSPFVFKIYLAARSRLPPARRESGEVWEAQTHLPQRYFISHPSYISGEVTSVDVISYSKFLITALYLAPPWFNSSVRPPLQALCSPLIEPIIPPRGTEAAPLPQMTP